MPYYEDLSPYAYFTETIPPDVSARAVGWLDPARPYTQAEPSEEFADRLFALCRDHLCAITHGWYGCTLCRRRLIGGGRFHPVSVSRGGERILVGHGEVRVEGGGGTWLIAPDLVVHYVLAHRYAPPEPFVEAVLAGRVVAGCR
ncbi:hypothetical protein PV350_34510 [Streptomyces sp. PA03-6a]|nr:hypothetical protein [Streptomyces sp. PA03-6a]